MKIILLKNKGNKTSGWCLEAETTEDKLILGTIRKYEFFGCGEDHPKYDGIDSEETEEGSYVTKLRYKIPSQQ
jgi:hypothetical protein